MKHIPFLMIVGLFWTVPYVTFANHTTEHRIQLLEQERQRLEQRLQGVNQELNALRNPTIVVLSPNGGEILRKGEAHLILWSSNATSTFAFVKIELRAENGTLYRIIERTQNDGRENWVAPSAIGGVAIPDGNYRLRISKFGTTQFDESDALFTLAARIPPSITSFSPALGPVGSRVAIQGTRFSPTGLSLDFGTGQATTTLTARYLSPTQIEFTVPQRPTGSYLLAVRTQENGLGPVSPARFTITQPSSLRLTAPNTALTLRRGEAAPITWDSTLTSGTLTLSLVSASAPVQTFIIASNVSVTAHTRPWNAGAVVGGVIPPEGEYRIRIARTDNATDLDDSDAAFTLANQVGPSVTAVTPAVAISGESITVTGTRFTATGNTVRMGTTAIGTLPASGGTTIVFTVPSGIAAGEHSVTVENTNGTSNAVNLTVNAFTPLAVTTSSVSHGVVGVPYEVTLGASGGRGAGNYTWSLASGSLPAGVTLSVQGVISGTPTNSGTFSPVVRLADGLSSVTRSYSLTVSALNFTVLPASGNSDTNFTFSFGGTAISRFEVELSCPSVVTGNGCGTTQAYGTAGTFIAALTNSSAAHQGVTATLRVYGSAGLLGTRTLSVTIFSAVAPRLTSLAPTSGISNATVTLIGTGFTATGNTVAFGPLTISTPTYVSATQLRFTIPAAFTTAGTHAVTVSNTNGTTNALTFTIPAPTWSASANPVSGEAPFPTTIVVNLRNNLSCGENVTFNFGNGSVPVTVSGACATGVTPTLIASRNISRSVTYQADGTYTARVSMGGVERTISVIVAAPPSVDVGGGARIPSPSNTAAILESIRASLDEIERNINSLFPR